MTQAAPEQYAALGTTVRQAMARLGVPGAVVGVLHGGEEYAAGFGVTNVDHPLPVDAGTLGQVGSITKTVTATAAMRLVERGALELDAPVRTYLPELRLVDEAAAARVTLRHLLTHTGGWAGDYFDDPGPGDDALARLAAGLAELPQLTPLGAVWSYNNAGFYLAGRLIELATGKTYEAAARELVLAPLGMSSSYFSAGEVITHRFLVGHLVEDGVPKVARPWAIARGANAVGGLISTAGDQLRYARFHMGDGTAPDGTRLLSAAAIELMRTPVVPTDRSGGHVGLSWMLREREGVRIVSHGGATRGQLANLTLVPSRGFAVVVLCNARGGGALPDEVAKWALAHYLGLPDQTPALRETPADALREYAGTYRGALSTADAELTLRDGGLVMQQRPKGGFPTKETPPPPTPPPVRVAFCGDDAIVALDPPFKDTRGEFLRDASGKIEWLRIGGRILRRDDE